MKIERHETGPRMSKAVIHGDTVYLAGIVADSPKSKSVAEQTRSILSQIDNFLAIAGTDKTKLLSANIWITDMTHFGEMNTVWDAWVSPGNTPARATVEAKLAHCYSFERREWPDGRPWSDRTSQAVTLA